MKEINNADQLVDHRKLGRFSRISVFLHECRQIHFGKLGDEHPAIILTNKSTVSVDHTWMFQRTMNPHFVEKSNKVSNILYHACDTSSNDDLGRS
jgi:hypothetical protein